MEDAHAFANSLTWGPDGWLYGAQGSTVTAHIRGIEFQQGIWRYHPITKEFELFAEGGGNTWGLDFNEEGEILAGTNFDEKMIHQVQGAYYIKNFGKHGALHNPHTYGYFNHVPYTGYRGGHISIGGIIYRGAAFPASFNGAYIFGNTLDHAVYYARLQPQGSSFTAAFAGTLLKTKDELFRPVDCAIGPDGAIYVADWCDKRASHVDPLDTWDRSNGRIYRVQNRSAKPVLPAGISDRFDLAQLTSEQLADLLEASNDWFVRQARRLLAERRDRSLWPRLARQARGNTASALPALWALYVSGGFNDSLAADLLRSTNAGVRTWTIRLLGDTRQLSDSLAKQLGALAKSEPHPAVRAQLACTVKRLPGSIALPILEQLIGRAEDVSDPQIPLLLWWALEDKAISDQSQVLKLFAASEIWAQPIARQFLLQRLARRYVEEQHRAGLAACSRLLQAAPDETGIRNVLAGIEEGLAGVPLANPPDEFTQWFVKVGSKKTDDPAYLRFGLLLGDAAAREAALRLVRQPATTDTVRADLTAMLSQQSNPADAPLWLELLEKERSDKVRQAALRALQRASAATVGEQLFALYPRLTPALQEQVRDAASSQPAWAALLVRQVDQSRIDPKTVTLEQLRKMAALNDPELDQAIQKRWGRIQAASPEEKQNSINRLMLTLKPSGVVGRDAKGDLAAGKQVFQQACATCHKLFDEGNNVGPDLTGMDRRNTHYLLTHIVNPSAFIRPEYVSFDAELKDESLISGLMVESSATAVTLLDRNNQKHLLPRSQIKQLKESTVSLMPDGLLEALPPQSVMDLFAYLQIEAAPPVRASKAP
jgi:putative heme-binding domain-containing protein